MGVFTERVLALAGQAAPTAEDVSFPTRSDLAGDTWLLQQPSSGDFVKSPHAQAEQDALPALSALAMREHLAAASACLAAGDRKGCTQHLGRARAVAKLNDAHHLSAEIGNALQDVARQSNATHPAGGAPNPEMSAGGKVTPAASQSSKADPANPSNGASFPSDRPNGGATNGAKFTVVASPGSALALARPYIREEHGREEHVGGYQGRFPHGFVHGPEKAFGDLEAGEHVELPEGSGHIYRVESGVGQVGTATHSLGRRVQMSFSHDVISRDMTHLASGHRISVGAVSYQPVRTAHERTGAHRLRPAIKAAMSEAPPHGGIAAVGSDRMRSHILQAMDSPHIAAPSSHDTGFRRFTSSLDQVVALAGSGAMTRPYERAEHGREERVGGYMKTLRHAVSGKTTGMLSPAHYGLLEGGGRQAMYAPEHGETRAIVGSHLARAAEAIHHGDMRETSDRLSSAANHASHGGMSETAAQLFSHLASLHREHPSLSSPDSYALGYGSPGYRE